MANAVDVRQLDAGERRRWPILRQSIAVPEWVLPDCCSNSLDWRPSQLLRFDGAGQVRVRRNDRVRNSESVALSADQNAMLWDWFRPFAAKGFAAWRAAHPGYLPEGDEPLRGQLIRYSAGHFFTAHSDFSFFPLVGRHRVLMALLGVSDADAYKGGEIVFETCPARYKLDRGDLVIYPAALLHEVEPIVSGMRITLLAELNAALSPTAFQRYVDQFQHEPDPGA